MERIKSFDFCKGICMLWIVGIWHLFSGYFNIPIRDNSLCLSITYGCLSTFIFISGYLAGRKDLKNKSEMKQYYVKKLISYCPLYFASIITLIPFKWFSSYKMVILTVLGLSVLFPPMPGTIWYATILLLFYFITPLFLIIKSTTKKCFVGITIWM